MRLYRALSAVLKPTLPDVKRAIDHFSAFNPSPVSLQQLLQFGNLLKLDEQSRIAGEKSSFLFLRQEIPVRLANMMKEIRLLPNALVTRPSVQIVESWYQASVEDLLPYVYTTATDSGTMSGFCKALDKIRNRHSTVVETMAQGIIELKTQYPVDAIMQSSIQYFLDRFYMSRISIRTLLNQHVMLFGNEPATRPRNIGCIDPSCDVVSAIQDAYYDARFLCEQYYLAAPALQLEIVNCIDPTDKTMKVVYIPAHLHHMLFELFKNAMRAVVESHGGNDTNIVYNLPPIKVTACMSAEDVTIRVSDRGGGIPLRNMPLLFLYMYSTAPQPSREPGMVPLAGFGYGLPLSRLYARYLLGDLQLTSIHGYGTDAVIYLKTMCQAANEVLPVFNKAALRRYESPMYSHDWCNAGGSSSGMMPATLSSFSSATSTASAPAFMRNVLNGSPKTSTTTTIVGAAAASAAAAAAAAPSSAAVDAVKS